MVHAAALRLGDLVAPRDLVVRLSAARADSARVRWLTTFVPVAAIMLLTTNYGPTFFVDGGAAFHPAWHLVHHGHLFVDDLPLRTFAFVEGPDGHLYSNRTVGLIATVVPAYLFSWGDTPSGVPAAVTTALLAAGSVATLVLILEHLLTRRIALYVALVAGFGTSLWSVAAAEYFPHAANVFWLLLAVLAVIHGRHTWAGLALMAAVTTRPHLAVVALVLGLWAGAATRSLKPVATIGAASSLGLLIVMLYNKWIFGGFNLQGGYDEYVTRPITSPLPATSATPDLALNVLGSLFSGPRGLLVLTPVLLLLLPGLPRAWSSAPWWARANAVSGLAYTFVQFQIQNGPEGFLGGYLFYSYRYTLEGLFLCAPLLALSLRESILGSQRLTRLTVLAAAVSIWIHGVGALLYGLRADYPFHPWLGWSPATTLAGSSAAEVAMALVGLAALLAGALWVVRPGQLVSVSRSR
jgi:hypothetical protein